MSDDRAARARPSGPEYDDDEAGFGDSGRFGAVAERRRDIHWPTVLVSGAVAAVISSLMLTLGVIGFHRSEDGPSEIVVAVDPRGTVTVDGTRVADGLASSSSTRSPSGTTPPPGTTPASDSTLPPSASTLAPAGEDGGGLSPATGGATPTGPAPSAVPAPEPHQPGQAPTEAPAETSDEAPTAQSQRSERVTGWTPPEPLPADFRVTTAEPTLDDLNAIVHLLVATPAPDAAKARNLEAGPGAVIVPKTVYNLGIFRAPQGWKRITGPLERNGDAITATLHSASAGRPSITTRVVFVRTDGNWKLSSRSVCEGVRAVGLPIGCGA